MKRAALLLVLGLAACVPRQTWEQEKAQLQADANTFCLSRPDLWTDATEFRQCTTRYQIAILENRIAATPTPAAAPPAPAAPSMSTCNTRRLMDGTLQTVCF